MAPCKNEFAVGNAIAHCEHDETVHDEDGCILCDCGHFESGEDGETTYGPGGGDSPAYRREMRDAGRGHLLP